MMKKITALLLALTVCVVLALGCFALAPTGTVSYDGESLDVSGDMQGFDQLVPGIEKSGALKLENETSDETANLYMSTEVVDNLINASKNSKDGAFGIKLTCDDAVLYGYDVTTNTATGTLVGGQGTQGLKELDKSLQGDLLVATLKPGETAQVELTLTLDPLVDNSYELSEGLIQFKFKASEVTPQVEKQVVEKDGKATVITKTRYLVQAAATGDSNLIFVAGGVLVLALAVFFLAGRKKKEDR